MPNCFQLFPKGHTEPAILQRVDEAICAHLDIPVDPKEYAYGWFNCIGFGIACYNGQALGTPKLRQYVIDQTADLAQLQTAMLAILDYLEAHYTSDAFVQIGK